MVPVKAPGPVSLLPRRNSRRACPKCRALIKWFSPVALFVSHLPSGKRRPNPRGNPVPNSCTPVNSLISFSGNNLPPKWPPPCPGAERAPAPGGSAGHGAAAEPAPRSAPRFAGGRERPSAPPVPLCAGCAVLFEAGAGGRTRRCQPPREAGGAGIRAAVLRPPVSQRGGAGTRPGRSRQKAVREYAR